MKHSNPMRKIVKQAVPAMLGILLLTGCAGSDAAETTAASVSGETISQVIDFSQAPRLLKPLPEGCEAYGTEENGLFGMTFTSGAEIIGRMEAYPIPEDVLFDTHFRWLETLGIPDYGDPDLCRSGGSSLYGSWEMHFQSDCPPGVEPTVDRYHTFLQRGDVMYDVWFDLMVTDKNTMWQILGALTGTEPQLETPVTGISFTDVYQSNDGTAEFVILTGTIDAGQVQAANGMSLEQLMEKAKEEFISTSVDSYGFDPATLGPEGEGARLDLTISDVVKGMDYLVAPDTPVPTVELWGRGIYILENGERMGTEDGASCILTLNALNGEVLARIGKK